MTRSQFDEYGYPRWTPEEWANWVLYGDSWDSRACADVTSWANPLHFRIKEAIDFAVKVSEGKVEVLERAIWNDELQDYT